MLSFSGVAPGEKGRNSEFTNVWMCTLLAAELMVLIDNTGMVQGLDLTAEVTKVNKQLILET